MEDAMWMLFFAVLVLVGMVVWFVGPCELFAFGSVGEMPARCM